jgi:hypothetical protein
MTEVRERVRRIAMALPEVTADEGRHIGFRVRNKTFAWYLEDHHGYRRITLDVKAAPGVQQALVGARPQRYPVPAYLGSRGWVGVDLEQPQLDWDEVAALIKDAYRLTAPKRLAALV